MFSLRGTQTWDRGSNLSQLIVTIVVQIFCPLGQRYVASYFQRSIVCLLHRRRVPKPMTVSGPEPTILKTPNLFNKQSKLRYQAVASKTSTWVECSKFGAKYKNRFQDTEHFRAILPVEGLSAPISAFSKRLTASNFVDKTMTDFSS